MMQFAIPTSFKTLFKGILSFLACSFHRHMKAHILLSSFSWIRASCRTTVVQDIYRSVLEREQMSNKQVPWRHTIENLPLCCLIPGYQNHKLSVALTTPDLYSRHSKVTQSATTFFTENGSGPFELITHSDRCASLVGKK